MKPKLFAALIVVGLLSVILSSMMDLTDANLPSDTTIEELRN